MVGKVSDILKLVGNSKTFCQTADYPHLFSVYLDEFSVQLGAGRGDSLRKIW